MINYTQEELTELENFEKSILRENPNYKGITVNKEKPLPTFLSTGVMTIDYCLGGGIPEGKIIELFGWESSGKTTLAVQFMKAVQKSGRPPLLLDAECKFDPGFAQQSGLDLDNFALQEPKNLEDGLDFLRKSINSNKFGMVVLDSVAALAPKAEIEKSMEEHTMGIVAKAYSRVLREISSTADNNKCTIVLINQLRSNISSYGGGTVKTSGNAIAFYASMILELKRDKQKDTIDSSTSLIKVTKNSLGPKLRTGYIEICSGVTTPNGEIIAGIDIVSDLLNIAIQLGLIQRSGAWYFYKKGEENEIKTQGKDNMKLELRNNIEFQNQLTQEVKSLL